MHNRAARAVCTEDAVVSGDDGNWLHAESDLAIERCGPAQLGQIVSIGGRRTVITEAEVSDAEVANHRRRKRIRIGDHRLIGIESLRTAGDAGFRLIWISRPS